MKLKNLLTVAIGAGLLSLSGCGTDGTENETPDDSLKTLTISVASPAPEETDFVWAGRCGIEPFDYDDNRKFDITSGAGSANAVFEGQANESSSYYAAFPYNEKASVKAAIEGKDISTSIPREQTLSGNVSGFTAAGRVSKNVLKLFQAGAYIGITVPDDDVATITVASVDAGGKQVPMSGEIVINGFTGKTTVGDGTNTSLVAKGTFEKGSQYWLTVLPGQTYNGLYVTFTHSDGSTRTMSAPGFGYTVEAGKAYRAETEDSQHPVVESVDFGMAAIDLFPDGSFSADIKVRSGGVVYNLGDLDFGIVFSSSDDKVASVSADGKISALAKGPAKISALSVAGTEVGSISVNVINTEVLSSELTQDLIYTSGKQLVQNSVMQSFAFGEEDWLYFSQVGFGADNHANILSRRQKDGSAYEYMKLKYFGHGQNLTVETEDGETYCYLQSYGSKQSGGDYGKAQTLSKIRFVPGKEMTPQDTEENYWIPGGSNLQVSLDVENDMMLIYSEGTDFNYRIYRLSEAKGIVPEMKTLTFENTYGGEAGGPAETTEKPTVSVKDLSTIKPLYKFLSEPSLRYKQGYEINNGLIYVYEGAGNKNDGASPSSAAVYIVSLEGKILKTHTVEAVADMAGLKELNLTDTGFMEAEGLKISDDGKVRLGFASRGSDNVRRAVILEYNML